MSANILPQLVIPFAACKGDAWAEAMKALPAASLKNLGKLLQRMQLVETDAGTAESLSTPHERELAKIRGISAVDGLIPWAAAQAQSTVSVSDGKAWAVITLCHWAMGREHATMADPATLGLSEEHSRTLLGAMQPYFETEAIQLHYVMPGQWLAEGELFRDLPTASLDRVIGRNVDLWLSGTNTAPSLRRLHNEMQMLLYTHPVNDERAARKQLPVNSFWLSGTGALVQPLQELPADALPVPRSLANAVFSDDWSAYAKAWEALDANEIGALLKRQVNGERVRLILCGESNAQVFETAGQGLFSKLASHFSAPRPLDTLLKL